MGPHALSILLLEAAATVGTSQVRQVYSPIGVVSGGVGVGRGTGFLVGPCHVVTAKHVGGPNPKIVGSLMKFRIPLRGGRTLQSNATVVAAGDLDVENDLLSGDRRGDWMLLQLSRCIGHTVGWAELSSAEIDATSYWKPNSEPLQSAGFRTHWNWKLGPKVDESCRVTMISKDQLWNNCDVMPGDSGGPLYAVTKVAGHTRYLVFGLQSALTTPNGNYGSVIAAPVRQIRQYLPSM